VPRKVGHRESNARKCETCAHPQCARIDFLAASGVQLNAVAAQHGISSSSLYHHFHRHVTERYKKLIGASRLETFEALMQRCTEGDAETIDILDLLIRGQAQQWGIALDAGASLGMVQHANKVLQAAELRSKITRELVPAQSLTVNNYVLRDAAEIVQPLWQHPAAQQALVEWHEKRNTTRVIEHAAAAD
jgi:hypothetical protein